MNTTNLLYRIFISIFIMFLLCECIYGQRRNEERRRDRPIPIVDIPMVDIPLQVISIIDKYNRETGSYTFVMGTKETNISDLDKQAHKVKLTRPFRITRYEITNDQWCFFLNSYNAKNYGSKITSVNAQGKFNTTGENDNTWFSLRSSQKQWIQIEYVNDIWQPKSGFESFPFVDVSHNGAQAFCEFFGFRLPTEAEWEYACRAGNAGRYSFSNESNTNDADLKNYAWCNVNANKSSHEVGSKLPNAFGLYDMHGNVSEWCSDWYEYSYGLRSIFDDSIFEDPQGSKSTGYRVTKSGNWNESDHRCKSFYRTYFKPTTRSTEIGFRVVSDIEFVPIVNPLVSIPLNEIPFGKDYYTFIMGSKDVMDIGLTEHKVKLTNPFYMSQFEVTIAQWCSFLNDYNDYYSENRITSTNSQGKFNINGGDDDTWFSIPMSKKEWVLIEYQNEKWQPVGEGKSANRPMIFVSHYGAQAFCDFYEVRLPTEAEWEYTSRAGNKGEYSFSDEKETSHRELGNYAWFNDNSENRTHDVGSKQPNNFGLYDMMGNVFEWCSDWWGYGYGSGTKLGTNDISVNPIGETYFKGFRVYRGGGWDSSGSRLRSLDRNRAKPSYRSNDLGFRIVSDHGFVQRPKPKPVNDHNRDRRER